MMDAADLFDPYGRPARRTQWIVSTLAYHYGLDRGVENEIIVLATGLDQYLQEIFHHMDYQGGGKIPVEDFKALCEVLELSEDAGDAGSAGGSERLPDQLTFRHFHARLCGYFSSQAGRRYEKGRLLVQRDSEHIETQIRLRSPLRRREKPLCAGPSSAAGRHASGCRLGSCTKECYEEIVALEEAEDRISKLEDENASLRELIEDMRAALQSSDARCLALQVGLLKSQSRHKPEAGCLVAHQKQIARKSVSETSLSSSNQSSTKSLRSGVEEMELLRSCGGRQVEEATLQRRRLEQELRRWKEAAAALEECNQSLRREQADMRRKVEEARQAIVSSVKKVKELEGRASQVPALQRHIRHLEAQIRFRRTCSEEACWAAALQLNSLQACHAAEWNVAPALSRCLAGRDACISRNTTHTNYPDPCHPGLLDWFFYPLLVDEQLELPAQQGASQYQNWSEQPKVQLPGGGGGLELQLNSGCRQTQRCWSESQRDRCSPTGRAVTTPDTMEEQLLRSVEGQAASDEEEEKWTGEQRRQIGEVKRILSRLSCCGERCDSKAFKRLMANFGSWRSEESCSAVTELLERVTRLQEELELQESQEEVDLEQMKDSLVQELQQKAEKTELLQVELQMLETERVRLSLVEEKLVDILQLLQQLRDLNVSRRSLGKILLSTLESCSDPQHGKAHILEVLNALYHELAACEVLSAGGRLDRTPSQQSLNTLFISC